MGRPYPKAWTDGGRRFPAFVDNAESERWRQVMSSRCKRTGQKLLDESTGRASYRTVLGSMLLRKLDWKK